MEVMDFISWLLRESWYFFTRTKVPGFDFSFAALFVGLFLASLGLRFLSGMIGVGMSSGLVTGVLKHKETDSKGK